MMKYGCFLMVLAVLQGCMGDVELVSIDLGEIHPFEIHHLDDHTTLDVPDFFDLKSGERLAVSEYEGMFVVPQLPEGKYQSVMVHKDRRICLEFTLVDDIPTNEEQIPAMEPMVRELLDSLEAIRESSFALRCSFTPAIRDSILLRVRSLDLEGAQSDAMRTMLARTDLFRFYPDRFRPMWVNEKGLRYKDVVSLNPDEVLSGEIGLALYAYATRADTLLRIHESLRNNQNLFTNGAAYLRACELAIMCQYAEWNEFLDKVLSLPVTLEKVLRLYTPSGDTVFYGDRYYENILLDMRYSNKQLPSSRLWGIRVNTQSQMEGTRMVLEDGDWIGPNAVRSDSNCRVYRSIKLTRRPDRNFKIWAGPAGQSDSIVFRHDVIVRSMHRPVFFEEELRPIFYCSYVYAGREVNDVIGPIHLVHHEGRGIPPSVSIGSSHFGRMIEGSMIDVGAQVELEGPASFSTVSVPVTWFRDGEVLSYDLTSYDGLSRFSELTRAPDRVQVSAYLGDWRTERPGPEDPHVDFDIVVE